jgi:hypothetical protein
MVNVAVATRCVLCPWAVTWYRPAGAVGTENGMVNTPWESVAPVATILRPKYSATASDAIPVPSGEAIPSKEPRATTDTPAAPLLGDS